MSKGEPNGTGRKESSTTSQLFGWRCYLLYYKHRGIL
jgi:hypothetical protein